TFLISPSLARSPLPSPPLPRFSHQATSGTWAILPRLCPPRLTTSHTADLPHLSFSRSLSPSLSPSPPLLPPGYEWDVGHFAGAVRPPVDNFRSTEFGLQEVRAGRQEV
ncbi:unnamed protein product, partial [Closterium sp. NIES-53]